MSTGVSLLVVVNSNSSPSLPPPSPSGPDTSRARSDYEYRSVSRSLPSYHMYTVLIQGHDCCNRHEVSISAHSAL